LQINYNITRIEEWCKSHDMPEGTLQLEHLQQATKLLQLKKATIADIEIIFDICWMLTPTQIQKLINVRSLIIIIDFSNITPLTMSHQSVRKSRRLWQVESWRKVETRNSYSTMYRWTTPENTRYPIPDH
jgi:myosin heavy subunit